MSQELYSVEQVAERLNLNVRTIRGYVRDGRLKAVRIGKQYRIAREDLEAFTGQPTPALPRDDARRERHVEVSSIVQIDAVSPELAGRMTNGLMGAGQGRGDGAALRIESIYDAARVRLKLVVLGDLTTTASLLGLVNLYLE
jgi:excisionase family DNA binding protein